MVSDTVPHIRHSRLTYHGVDYRVRGLDGTRVRVREDGAQKPDLLHDVDTRADLYAVADVVGMFDEEEDDRRQDFGQRASNEPAQT